MFSAILSTYFESRSQLLIRYVLLILIGPEIRDLLVDQHFEILKNRRKVKMR